MKIYDQIVVVIFFNLYVGPAYERETIHVFKHSVFVLKKLTEIVIFYQNVLQKCCENLKNDC